MFRQHRLIHAVAASATAIALSISAQAQANRTFVSTTGSDSNTSTNCGATTPCRTFGAALSVTNSAGEVLALSSGGYGAFTITQAVTVNASPGIEAAITQTTSGQNAINVNTSGNVTITGLHLLGGDPGGNDGISVTNVGHLQVDSVNIENFLHDCIEFLGGGSVDISNSEISNCGHDGFDVDVSTGMVTWTAENCKFANDGNAGIDQVWGGTVGDVDNSSFIDDFIGYSVLGLGQVSRSHFAGNGTGISVGGSGGTGIAKALDTYFNHNATGLAVNSGGEAHLVGDRFSFNTNAITLGTGGSLIGTNPGTTFVEAGQGTTPTFGIASTLH